MVSNKNLSTLSFTFCTTTIFSIRSGPIQSVSQNRSATGEIVSLDTREGKFLPLAQNPRFFTFNFVFPLLSVIGLDPKCAALNWSTTHQPIARRATSTVRVPCHLHGTSDGPSGYRGQKANLNWSHSAINSCHQILGELKSNYSLL